MSQRLNGRFGPQNTTLHLDPSANEVGPANTVFGLYIPEDIRGHQLRKLSAAAYSIYGREFMINSPSVLLSCWTVNLRFPIVLILFYPFVVLGSDPVGWHHQLPLAFQGRQIQYFHPT